ncbi:MAG TPA: hypothetical protein EYN66_06045 [Myxococcales bacterium]|nr:hypothetical protein [Myxococcales bacterium]
MYRVVAVLLAMSFLNLGCYNTFVVNKAEFAKLQQKSVEEDVVTVTDGEGQRVVVGENTKIYVRSDGGRRYPVTAFNFKMTETQLVASDRDTLLMLGGVSQYEIDHISTLKTVGLISLGAAAAAGVIVSIILTSGAKSFN